MIGRVRILAICIFVGFGVIFTRLYYWQVIRAESLSERARYQHTRRGSTNSQRGSILSSDGTWLATSKRSWLLYAQPNKIENGDEIADSLSFLLSDESAEKKDIQMEAGRIKDLLSKKNLHWVALKTRIDDKLKANIESLNHKFLGFEEQEQRYYPEASVSAHLLGFVGKNSEGSDEGYFGLEGYYNNSLSAKEGLRMGDFDVKGDPILAGDFSQIPSVEGVDLVTNIDKTVQFYVDRGLKKALNDYGASQGTVVVMDPKSGGILAMSSYPSYDPVEYWNYSDSLFLNPAISQSFEPGSVFKIVAMASALDAEVVEPDSRCDICHGPLKIDKYTIGTWNDEYHPDSTMTEVIVNSDNIGMVYVARELGIDKMLEYLKKFGVGDLTGIDLQGEMTPNLRGDSDWGEVDLITSSFGQGIAVTPVQMIKAAAIIANDGLAIKPNVVKGVFIDGAVKEIGLSKEERVISKKASDEITLMMVEAAKSGEAKWTHLKNFRVAGKTGTAQIPVEGHYDEEKTIASFVGFAPYDDPKFVMLVTLKEPQTSPWASETAAPLWYKIAKDLFLYFGIMPDK
jgi:stage V sporulation protein D (sporulation-specific penicillin-binding protein)